MGDENIEQAEKQMGIPAGSPYKTHIPTVEDYFKSDDSESDDPSVARKQQVDDSDAVQDALSQIPGLADRMNKKK